MDRPIKSKAEYTNESYRTKGEEERNARLVKERLENDLKALSTKILWREQAQKDWAPVHDEIEEFLKRPGRRKLILIPRGHLKSSVITKSWSIQQVLKDLNLRVLIASDTWENSRKFLRTIQKYLINSALKLYYGEFQSEHWNMDECTVKQRTQILDAATWSTTGIEKEQTSQHYDLIIADDLVARENVGTKEQREKVKTYYKDLLDLLEPAGRLVVIGTRWHQDDLYAMLLEEKGWEVMLKTAYTDESRSEVIYPQKFSLEYLQSLRNSKGAYHFASQYLNNPVDSEAADFKYDWMRYYDPTTQNPHRLILAVDPARSLNPDADFSGFTVSGMYPNRKIRLVDILKKRLVPSGVVDEIFNLVKKWKERGHFVECLIESFGYQKTLKFDVQRRQREENFFFPVHEFKKMRGPSGEKGDVKEARIRALQPLFEQGLYEIRDNMKEFEDELLSFPRGKYDDLIDSAAMALEYLSPSSVTVKNVDSLGEYKDELGRYRYSVNHWLKNFMPKPAGSIYERFFADMK